MADTIGYSGGGNPCLDSAPFLSRLDACVAGWPSSPNWKVLMLVQGLSKAAPTAPISGGGGGAGIQRDPTADLAPWRPSAGDVWDRKKAAHLLRRAGFGGNLEEIDAVVALGLDRTVDLLLSPSTQTLKEYGVAVLPHGELLNLTYSLAARRALWIHEAVHTLHPLKEKMAVFWHDHFSVGSENQQSAATLTRHINIFRQHGLGNFRDVLIEVTRDPAMLYWLDNNVNGARGIINENYGRELLELYSIGVTGGYTQNDVVQAATCLTGWSLTGFDQFLYNARNHIAGNKTVLGVNIPSAGMAEVFQLIDILLNHQLGGKWQAAEYVGRKIWEYFVAENPDPALVTELANRWKAVNYDIRSLMSIILRSTFFYGAGAYRQLVKSPMDFVCGAIRGTRASIGSYSTLGNRVQAMGLPLMAYTNPAGLEEGAGWIDSSTMIARANFANELSQVSTADGVRAGLDVFREIVRYNLTTADQIVDHYLALLVDGDVPPFVRTVLIEFMNRIDSGSSPFQLTAAKVNEKVRGLVHLIMSLPEYQVN